MVNMFALMALSSLAASAPIPLQPLIDAASAGAVLELEAARYAGPVRLDRDLTLRGKGPDGTIIDGQDHDAVVTVSPGLRVRIEGLTLTNGAARAARYEDGVLKKLKTGMGSSIASGGGLRIQERASVVLESVNIIENTSQSSGSGIFADREAHLTLNEVLVRGNSGAWANGSKKGRAVAVLIQPDATLEARALRIQENVGWGLMLHDVAGARLTDVIVADNEPTLPEREGCWAQISFAAKTRKYRVRMERVKVSSKRSCDVMRVDPGVEVVLARDTRWPGLKPPPSLVQEE